MYRQKTTDLMRARISCRHYQSREIEEQKKQALTGAFAACRPSPFGHLATFYLIEEKDRRNKKVRLGTYGMIKNPQYFLVGTIRKSEKAFESYGYLFQQIILKATELGLGTCWLGYFYKRSAFKYVPLGEGEVLPAVSPVGYGSLDRGLYDWIVKKTVTPRRRKSWDKLFFQRNMEHPLTVEAAGPYAVALEMVRIAPSAGNRQPWRIIKEREGNRYHFYLDHSRPRKGYDKRNLPRIDMGIAMCHFELACAEGGLSGRWELNPPKALSLPSELEYVASWCGEDPSQLPP